jgi:hypothetical protein
MKNYKKSAQKLFCTTELCSVVVKQKEKLEDYRGIPAIVPGFGRDQKTPSSAKNDIRGIKPRK